MNNILKRYFPDRTSLLYFALAPAITLLVIGALSRLKFFERVENLTVDLRFQWREASDPPANPAIIMVGIDEVSLKTWGRWPFPRSVHGDFLQLVSLSDPAVVAFDLFFSEPSNPDDDAYFADQAFSPRAVITGAVIERPEDARLFSERTETIDYGLTRALPKVEGDILKIPGERTALLPYPSLRQNSFFGFVDTRVGSDGIRRWHPMVIRIGNEVFPAFSLQALAKYLGAAPEDIHVVLGESIVIKNPSGPDFTIPINAEGMMYLNYRSPDRFVFIDYSNLFRILLKYHVNGEPLPEGFPAIENRILFVGQVAAGLSDLGPNPFSGHAPLMLTHVNAVDNILQRDHLTFPSMAMITVGWLLLGYLVLFILRELRILFTILLPVMLILGYITFTWQVFDSFNLVLPVAWPILGFVAISGGSVIQKWREEMRSKQAVKAVFATYVSGNIMDTLLADPDNIQLGGQTRNVTILFSDIRGFTTYTETLHPVDLVAELNHYFERMVGAVMRHNGTLQKYIGDAIMAVWGDISSAGPATDAKRAVRAALEMRRQLAELNDQREAEGLVPIRIGIGLNHGEVVAGNVGATMRKEFTVIGDPVNLASRLEGVTKQFKTDLVIGESVAELIDGEFLLRTVGLIQVKGKTRPIRVFEVLDDRTKPTGAWDEAEIAIYEEGVEHYLNRRFEEARECFQSFANEHPRDFNAFNYLRSAIELIENPPPPDWDGVLILTSK